MATERAVAIVSLQSALSSAMANVDYESATDHRKAVVAAELFTESAMAAEALVKTKNWAMAGMAIV